MNNIVVGTLSVLATALVVVATVLVVVVLYFYVKFYFLSPGLSAPPPVCPTPVLPPSASSTSPVVRMFDSHIKDCRVNDLKNGEVKYVNCEDVVVLLPKNNTYIKHFARIYDKDQNKNMVKVGRDTHGLIFIQIPKTNTFQCERVKFLFNNIEYEPVMKIKEES